MIRTLVEVRGGRVSIQESSTETTVTVTVDDETSDDGLLSNEQVRSDIAQAAMKRNLERQVQELATELERYRRAHVCTVECKPNQHTAFQGRQQVAELEKELESARANLKAECARVTELEAENARMADNFNTSQAHVRELEALVLRYDLDRTTERDRADQNKAWAERAELRLAQQAEEAAQGHAARDRLLASATSRISAARDILTAGSVGRARDAAITKHSVALANAIGEALDALNKA